MAAKNSSKPKLAAAYDVPAGVMTSPSINDIVGELFQIDALLNGALAIVSDIKVTGTGPSQDLDYDALNALKLLREAIRRIPLLAESIGFYDPMRRPKEVANG